MVLSELFEKRFVIVIQGYQKEIEKAFLEGKSEGIKELLEKLPCELSFIVRKHLDGNA
jgi:hypothetical protein